MRPLPDRRLDSAKRVRVRVNTGSLIAVGRNNYSVNSRLIGEMVEARLCSDHLEVWYGGQKVEQLPRLHGRTNIASTTATSSTGWCASRAPSRTTATASTCFRAARSGRPTTCCRRSCPAAVTAVICRSWNWRRKKEKPGWRMPCACCWPASRGEQTIADKEAFEQFLERCEQAPEITDVPIPEVPLSQFRSTLERPGRCAMSRAEISKPN